MQFVHCAVQRCLVWAIKTHCCRDQPTSRSLERLVQCCVSASGALSCGVIDGLSYP
ncbi:hypothetical protein THTE_0490 [Thermogutta terrifontis]|uniref:Uncharacterized protein n=1 Tax=Thermogutta terrifontis TaxID=1331910 RepID=A0A286RAU9_9BACT|nr:hypothetical protein THTE_0490 [Thermogutta terrifontis]